MTTARVLVGIPFTTDRERANRVQARNFVDQSHPMEMYRRGRVGGHEASASGRMSLFS